MPSLLPLAAVYVVKGAGVQVFSRFVGFQRRARGCCTLRCVPRWYKRVALSSGWATEMWSRDCLLYTSDAADDM
eukprot:11206984-Alexandrium_andersonii.AAC.1